MACLLFTDELGCLLCRTQIWSLLCATALMHVSTAAVSTGFVLGACCLLRVGCVQAMGTNRGEGTNIRADDDATPEVSAEMLTAAWFH